MFFLQKFQAASPASPKEEDIQAAPKAFSSLTPHFFIFPFAIPPSHISYFLGFSY